MYKISICIAVYMCVSKLLFLLYSHETKHTVVDQPLAFVKC